VSTSAATGKYVVEAFLDGFLVGKMEEIIRRFRERRNKAGTANDNVPEVFCIRGVEVWPSPGKLSELPQLR